MGLDYSLCAIIPRGCTADLLHHLCALLDPVSKARIAQLDWSPAIEQRRDTLIGATENDAWGLSGLELGEFEHNNSYCFSLQIQLEPEMKWHFEDDHFTCFDQPGPFGCMWTSIRVGYEYVIVEMTAATTGMSMVLQYSDAVHKCWRQFAEKSKAVVAYIDLENDCAIQLFPNSGDLILPYYETFAYNGDHRTNVDRIVEYVRHVNGV